MTLVGSILSIIGGVLGLQATLNELLVNRLSLFIHLTSRSNTTIINALVISASLLLIIFSAISIHNKAKGIGVIIAVLSTITILFGSIVVAITSLLPLIGGFIIMLMGEERTLEAKELSNSKLARVFFIDRLENPEEYGGLTKDTFLLYFLAAIFVWPMGLYLGISAASSKYKVKRIQATQQIVVSIAVPIIAISIIYIWKNILSKYLTI